MKFNHKAILLFVVILGLSNAKSFSLANLTDDSILDLFDTFNKQHKKSHSSLSEFMDRLKAFTENLFLHSEYILFENNQPLFSVFFDMTTEEFKKTYLSFKAPSEDFLNTMDKVEFTGKSVPDHVDWRDEHVVTEVKNQEQCGSCWAFSAIGNIESINAIKNKKLESLSEQQLVDCDLGGEDQGCNGGLMEEAMKYIIKTGGVNSEKDYPYKGHRDQCKFDPKKVVVSLKGYKEIEKNEEALKEAVANIGPISIAVNALTFQFYIKGIFNPIICQKSLDHGVVVVGYGSENGKDYWLIKNSWGKMWGEHGYIRLIRNHNQKCGISTYNFTAETN